MAFISNGTTILDNGAFQASLGSMVLLSEQTASASSSISFTTGIDSTYPIYKFDFINIHPSTNAIFRFNLSTNSGSTYAVTKTTTLFQSYHAENDSISGLIYESDEDMAQSTSDANLYRTLKSDNDSNLGGTLYLFNPSSTTFVKHFISEVQGVINADYSIDVFVGGYGNTTSAINAVKFLMSSGNIDSGTIKLYGIKDS